MDLEDRIQTRAYFNWLEREDKHSPVALDDWLAAEREEVANLLAEIATRVALPELSFNQDDVWYSSEQISALFGLLKPLLQKRRSRSCLLSLIEEYQDYLTSSRVVSDEEAERQGANALSIFRIATSLGCLIGKDFRKAAMHSFAKELKDLFAEDRTSFQTAEFNLYSAAAIQRQTGMSVSFIAEGAETTPDLQVGELAYVECKDIHTQIRSNIEKTLSDNLDKAHGQLAAAQSRKPLVGTGICIDLPWRTLPLSMPEWTVIRRSLSVANAPQFILLSSSGVNPSKTGIGFPVATCLVWGDSATPLFDPLLRHLTQHSYRMLSDDFEEISH